MGNNLSNYKTLILLSMVYITIMLCNVILTNRYVGTNDYFVLGGTMIAPFVFILDDIIAEIYGYKIIRFVIFSGYATQTLFCLICKCVTISPHPDFFKAQDTFSYILGNSLIRLDISGFLACIIANLVNSYLLSKWKILLRGQYFWLRSIASSTLAEALYSFLAIVLMEINAVSLDSIFKIIILSFLIKILCTFIFAFPANWIVVKIKKLIGMDIYDFPVMFTSLRSL